MNCLYQILSNSQLGEILKGENTESGSNVFGECALESKDSQMKRGRHPGKTGFTLDFDQVFPEYNG